MAGKLFVFEGTDGSGKATQFTRLCERLSAQGTPFETLSFPQYGQPSGQLPNMYLRGDFGTNPDDISPYAASVLYGFDRYMSLKTGWGERYRAGTTILCDRYTTSNAVHQASKLPPAGRADFFRWLFDYEYVRLGLPAPDGVFFLDMPTEVTVELLRRRQAETDTVGDIHEVDSAYLARCRAAALEAAALYGWHRIPCIDASGAIRTVEDIHSDIWALFSR